MLPNINNFLKNYTDSNTGLLHFCTRTYYNGNHLHGLSGCSKMQSFSINTCRTSLKELKCIINEDKLGCLQSIYSFPTQNCLLIVFLYAEYTFMCDFSLAAASLSAYGSSCSWESVMGTETCLAGFGSGTVRGNFCKEAKEDGSLSLEKHVTKTCWRKNTRMWNKLNCYIWFNLQNSHNNRWEYNFTEQDQMQPMLTSVSPTQMRRSCAEDPAKIHNQ